MITREDMVYMKLMVLKYDKKIKHYNVNKRKKRAMVIMSDGSKVNWTWSHIIINF